MKNINCVEMVKMYLQMGGYDGLINDECSCTLDDFAPCGCPDLQNCVAALTKGTRGEKSTNFENILQMRITKTRKERGLNKAQLARIANITPAAITQIEKGQRIPSLPVFYRLADVLGVSLDYLVGRDT